MFFQISVVYNLPNGRTCLAENLKHQTFLNIDFNTRIGNYLIMNKLIYFIIKYNPKLCQN